MSNRFFQGAKNFLEGASPPLVTGLAGTGSLSTAQDKLHAPLAHLLHPFIGIPGSHCATVWWHCATVWWHCAAVWWHCATLWWHCATVWWHCATVWWPASRFMVAVTIYSRHLELVFTKNLQKNCKRAKK